MNNTIRKITSAGVVTTLAGAAGQAGSADGAGSAARFNIPAGMAVDGSGNIYVADGKNYTIRKVTAGGVVTTLAGTAGQEGFVPGPLPAILAPTYVAFDATTGSLFITSELLDAVLKIGP